MKRTVRILVLFIAVFFVADDSLAQRASLFDPPLVSGERSIKFEVDTQNIRPDLLTVAFFYSDQRNRLNNLNDDSLSRGRPVLERDATFTNRLAASFVLPHQDYPADPNRSLYVRYKALGRDVVLYPDVETQLNPVTAGGGLFDFLSPDSGLADSTIDINPEVFPRDRCIFYRVRIERGGQVVFTSEILTFRMPDSYNIAVAGDSYGAGEGAPQDTFELIGDNEDMWSHNDCHRSRKSGLVRGVKRFIQHNPDTAIDYIHTACTGARVRNLFEDPQVRAVLDFSQPHPVQFDIIEDEFLEARDHPELNALLVSTGGNDAGFGAYVAEFVIMPFNAADDDSILGEIQTGLDRVAGRYGELDDAVNERFPNAKVVISNYPDSTNGPRGRCGRSNNVADFAAVYICCPSEVDPITNPVEEYTFTSNEFIAPLNDAVANAVTGANEPGSAPDWYLVDVQGRMGAHGLCACDDPHINRMGMTLAKQGDIMGVVHPTSLGHREVYRNPVAQRMADVYRDFLVSRKGGILIAKLLGIDSPAIPASCDPRFIPINPRLRDLVLRHSKVDRLREFLADGAVKSAFANGNLEELKRTAAYRRLSNDRRGALRIVADAFRKSTPRKRQPRPEVVTPRQRKALAALREYLRSSRYAALRSDVLKNRERYLKEVEDVDKLDRYFNRETPVRPKARPRRPRR